MPRTIPFSALTAEQRAEVKRVRPWVGRTIQAKNSMGTTLDIVFTGEVASRRYSHGILHLAYWRFHYSDSNIGPWNAPESGMNLDTLRDLPGE